MIHLLQITPKNQTVAACISQPSLLLGGWLVWSGHVSAWWMLLAFAVYMAMQLSITVGCHRLFTHRTFECHRIWHWLFSFFATLTWQASTISWVHVHYVHHAYSDTDQDSHISSWDFLFWKRYRSLTGKYSKAVAQMVKEPLHLKLHTYTVPFILGVGLVLTVIHPLMLLFGLVIPMGYYFLTSGLHQIFSHYKRIPRNLPWMELFFPMGEWLHAEHHEDASQWDFGKYDVGTYLIRWVRR